MKLLQRSKARIRAAQQFVCTWTIEPWNAMQPLGKTVVGLCFWSLLIIIAVVLSQAETIGQIPRPRLRARFLPDASLAFSASLAIGLLWKTCEQALNRHRLKPTGIRRYGGSDQFSTRQSGHIPAAVFGKSPGQNSEEIIYQFAETTERVCGEEVFLRGIVFTTLWKSRGYYWAFIATFFVELLILKLRSRKLSRHERLRGTLFLLLTALTSSLFFGFIWLQTHSLLPVMFARLGFEMANWAPIRDNVVERLAPMFAKCVPQKVRWQLFNRAWRT